ncbi:MAG: hypothetical protein EOP84_08555 [Verrucomicrobiaceae bacterium]|nr:MAG: hypothetical protein EOP84_08555 [Verrucomicrobiaceae bacterium]
MTRKDDFASFKNACGSQLTLWDEGDLVPGMTLPALRKLPLPFFPAGAGWYFQQFLKYGFHTVSNDDVHFLIWDADTVLLRPVEFFDISGRPIYTRAEERHPPYFETFKELFGVEMTQEFSFISQHQVINKHILREMLALIEQRSDGKSWPWAIMDNLRGSGSNLFSEYETYGHYLKWKHPDEFALRDLSWTRHGGGNLGLPPWKPVLNHLRKQYDFAAFEASSGLPRRIVRALR